MNNDSVLLWVLFVIIAIIVVFGLYLYIKHQLKHKIETITAFTGINGSGKSELSVDLALKLLFKNRRKLKKHIRKTNLRNKVLFWKTPKNVIFEEPLLFSNIPVIVKRPSRFLNWCRKLLHLELKKPVYSSRLTKDILLLQTSVPKGSIFLIDEVGSFASQFMFNDENVTVVFDEFVRLIRHYYAIPDTHIEPYLIVNDQASGNINYTIRRRLNTVHNLSNHFRIWRFVWYFERMISITDDIKTIDQKTSTGSDTQDNSNLRFKFLWRIHTYDSHCYSRRADNMPRREIYSYDELKTNYLLTCPKDKKKKYRAKTDTRKEFKE